MKTVWDELFEYYKDKHCVTFVKKEDFDYVSMVKAFTDRQEALDFQNQCKEDGTFVGYADLNAFPPMAIQKWIELQGDAKLPTTEVH
tara:strand:+ start:267 stop:527 length:261 start_codon:yes stop_codon:yes gene_type:complete